MSRTSNKTFTRPALRAALGLAATFVAMFVLTSPAWAVEGIQEFTTSSSTSAAGGHPTIETNIVLENPGSPEAAKDITVNTPAGVFGNPMAVTQCTAKQFAQMECSADSQVGLVTIHANYEGIHLGVQAGQMGAAYFLPTFIVPLFLITHGLMFWLLLRNESEAGEPAARRPS